MIGDNTEELRWRPIGEIDNDRLREARLQAHYAAQWLARVARGYIPPQPDDAHTSLTWDDAIDGFKTQPLRSGVWLSLQVSNLTLALNNGDGPDAVHSIFLSGRTNGEVREWLGGRLGKINVDAGSLDAPSPYKIPSHAIAKGAPYDALSSSEALTELAAWFANANALLGHIQRRLIERHLAASPVCCWPHHFDLASLTTLTKNAAEATGYVGVGLSPGDEYYDEPYFYVSVYPKPDPATLPSLPMFGHWHTHEFMAAIVPAHKIASAMNQKTETDEFLRCAVDTALNILS